jgi:asparagine synthase (glutamine-hydrolysing)
VSTGVMGGAAMVDCPFLDAEFVELGLSLPWSVTHDQKLHDDAIAMAYPDFAGIPYSDGFRGQPLPRLRKERLINGLDSLRVSAMARPGRAAVGAIRDVLARSPLRRGPADIYRLHNDFVQGMDAAEARRLLELCDQLSGVALKGEGVVSDVFPGA